MKKYKLHPRIKKLIGNHSIDITCSDNANDMEDAEFGEDDPSGVVGLFIWDTDNLKNKKQIWLKDTCPIINHVALHELSHYITIKAYRNKDIAKSDKETIHWVEELLAEGGALVLTHILGIRHNPQAIEDLRDIAKSIKIREKK